MPESLRLQYWGKCGDVMSQEKSMYEELIKLKNSNPEYILNPEIFQDLKFLYGIDPPLEGGSLDDLFTKGELSQDKIESRAYLFQRRKANDAFCLDHRTAYVSEEESVDVVRDEVAKRIYSGIVVQCIGNKWDFLKIQPEGCISFYGTYFSQEFKVEKDGFFYVTDNDSKSNHGHGLATIMKYQDMGTAPNNDGIFPMTTRSFREVERINCKGEYEFDKRWRELDNY